MNGKLPRLLEALEKALTHLESALNQHPNEFIRDSAIQRFEFSFELLWKSLKTFSDETGVRVFSPRDSLRSAFQLGIIPETDDWFVMLDDRNLMSHTYDEATAETIYAHLPKHLSLMQDALVELKKRVNV